MADEVRQETELSVAMLIFIALTVLGVAFGGFIVRDFACARASVSWRQVDAVILSPDPRSPELRFAYVADGNTHEASRVQFLTSGFSLGRAYDAAPGDLIQVMVDPEDPALSVIRSGGSGLVFAAYAALAGGLIFIGLGGLIRTLIINREQEAVSVTRRLEMNASS